MERIDKVTGIAAAGHQERHPRAHGVRLKYEYWKAAFLAQLGKNILSRRMSWTGPQGHVRVWLEHSEAIWNHWVCRTWTREPQGVKIQIIKKVWWLLSSSLSTGLDWKEPKTLAEHASVCFQKEFTKGGRLGTHLCPCGSLHKQTITKSHVSGYHVG